MRRAIFGHQVQKYFFFAFIKKILLQTLVEIIFKYHKKIFLEFWDPPGTPLHPKKDKRKFHILSVGRSPFFLATYYIKMDKTSCLSVIT